MIVYNGRFSKYLGQASAVPPEAPLTRVPPPATPVIPVVTPAPSVVDDASVAAPSETPGYVRALPYVVLGGIVLWAMSR
jgi:hypothetical protein